MQSYFIKKIKNAEVNVIKERITGHPNINILK